MIYQFRCPNGHKTEIAQSIFGKVPVWIPCLTCKSGARRFFNPNVQLVTQREVDRPDNRIGGVGFSQRDRDEIIRNEAEATIRAASKAETPGTKSIDEVDTRKVTEDVLKEACLL